MTSVNYADNLTFVSDFDGVFTDGKMYYSKNGKEYKAVGCDDWELVKELSNHIKVSIISADERGFPITTKRVKEEMKLDLYLVKGSARERWEWIKDNHPNKKIIYMGDSLGDYLSLKNSFLGITVVDALPFIKKCADVVIKRRGGDRAVAEAIMYINKKFKIFNLYNIIGK